MTRLYARILKVERAETGKGWKRGLEVTGINYTVYVPSSCSGKVSEDAEVAEERYGVDGEERCEVMVSVVAAQ